MVLLGIKPAVLNKQTRMRGQGQEEEKPTGKKMFSESKNKEIRAFWRSAAWPGARPRPAKAASAGPWPREAWGGSGIP